MTILILFLCFIGANGIFAEETTGVSKGKTCEEKSDLKEEIIETSHSMNINGATIAYKASTGTLLLKDEKDKVKASAFYIAYTQEDKDSNRPIAFCFNGGPGSSSVWLHLGALGPKRIAIDDEGHPLFPFHLIDNEYTLLDSADLVFIDPISTGYSRPAPGEDTKQFHGVEEDVKYVAEFIRLYVTRNGRWGSPKYLIGESYGTTRAASLANYLQDNNLMILNGTILLSTILNFQTLDFADGNDLPYLTYLPTYTATAWYHKKLPKELQDFPLEKVLKEVNTFITDKYSLALFKGDLLPAQEKEEIVKKLAYYTGLSPDLIDNMNIRVNMHKFAASLLKDEKMLVGRYDSRYTGICNKTPGDIYSYDPSEETVFGGFAAAFNQYVRRDLKWEKDTKYEILAGICGSWNFSKATNEYLNVSGELRDVMTKNPHMKVFVASGYYDLATPFAGADYTMNHLGLDPRLKDHITIDYYEAGHMMYLHKPSLVKLKKDLDQFMRDSTRK